MIAISGFFVQKAPRDPKVQCSHWGSMSSNFLRFPLYKGWRGELRLSTLTCVFETDWSGSQPPTSSAHTGRPPASSSAENILEGDGVALPGKVFPRKVMLADPLCSEECTDPAPLPQYPDKDFCDHKVLERKPNEIKA